MYCNRYNYALPRSETTKLNVRICDIKIALLVLSYTIHVYP